MTRYADGKHRDPIENAVEKKKHDAVDEGLDSLIEIGYIEIKHLNEKGQPVWGLTEKGIADPLGIGKD